MTAPLEFTLPERISVTGDTSLLPFLRSNPNAPVDVSAARLRRLDTPLLQALLIVAADRRARGVPFRLTGVSADQASQLAALGVTEAQLNIQVSA